MATPSATQKIVFDNFTPIDLTDHSSSRRFPLEPLLILCPISLKAFGVIVVNMSVREFVNSRFARVFI